MEQQGEPEYDHPAKTPVMGGVEYVNFRFKTINSGTNIIKLQYIRKWEKEKEPLKTYFITVAIN